MVHYCALFGCFSNDADDKDRRFFRFPKDGRSLFYLMVLATSHTISKSLARTESLEDAYDTFNDIDITKKNNLKHGRIHSNRHERYFDKVRNEEVINETTEKSKTCKSKIKKHGKTTDNRKLQRVWRKIHSKKETKKITQPEILVEQWQETPFAQLFENIRSSTIYNNVLDYIGNTNRLKKVKENTMKKHEKRTWIKRNKKAKMPVEYNLEKPPVKFKRNQRKVYATHRTKTERPGYDQSNITQILSAMSTKLKELKDLYSTSDYTTVISSTEAINNEEKNVENIITNIQNSEPIQDSDIKYGGTNTLEALLSDVKSKAIEMIASHPPAIANLITNAVTETTYSVDPLLTHYNNNPLFFLSTIATMDEEPTDQVTDKSILPGIIRDDNFSYFQYRTEPTRKVRALEEKGHTILMTWHDFHDKMQKKLKEMYHTGRSGVSKKVNTTKNVLKQTTKKITKKITSCPKLKTEQTVNAKPKLVKEMSNSSNWKPYSYLPNFKGHRTVRRKKQHSTPSLVPALEYNDYALLSLYERMLSKTHESNLMKFLATKSYPTMKRKIRQTEPVLELENNGNSGNVYESTTIDKDSNTVASIDETSYEGLSKKIAYDDFVNGFKHYLNFERDMAHSNFSNLVRYQAHRHHDVEEIGKYILEKIPQIPMSQDRDKRAFFDYYDDDQDVSTKSDDSWFKRHFYYFAERSGTPKKYHTSQTVALKNPLEENENNESQQSTEFVRNHVEFRVNNPSHGKAGPRLGWSTVMPLESGMSLDQLSFWLTGYSSPITLTPASTSTLPMTHEDHDNLLAFKNSLHSPHLLDKFLIGIGRASKKTTLKNNDYQTGDDGKFRRKREDDKIPEKNYRHEQKENAKATVPIKLYVKSTDSKSDKKLKFVNVNVAPASQHEGKRKFNWFRKLKFHKKKSNRTKREAERQPRFNIMTKIKHLFDPRTEASVDDYDLTKTKLKAYKPVKYDSQLSLDDMKLQVPDVSDSDKVSIKAVPEDDKMGVTQQMINIEHNYTDGKFYKTNTPKVTMKNTGATKYQNKIKENKNEDNTGATKYLNKIEEIENKDNTGATKYQNKIDKIKNEDITGATKYLNKIEEIVNKDDTGATKTQNKIEMIKNEIDTIALKMSRPTIADKIMSKQTITYDFTNHIAMQNEKNDKKLHNHVNPKTNIIIFTSSDKNHDFKTETADAVALRKYPSTKTMTILYPHLNNGDYDNRDTLIDVPETEVVSYSETQNFEGNKFGHTNTKFNLFSELPFTAPIKLDALINLGGSEKTTFTRKSTTHNHFHDFMIWNSDILHSDKYGKYTAITTEPATPTTMRRDVQSEFLDFERKKQRNEIFDLQIEPDVKFGKSARPRSPFLEVTPRMNIMKMKREKRTSKDFVKKLHGLQTFRKMKNSKRKFYPRDLNILMEDTSLFAYDDGLDYFTDSYKEIAKHSVSDSAMGNLSAPIKITPPHQYYTTPLPMMTDEFNHFLKENDLDVKSLTKSLPDTSDLDKLLSQPTTLKLTKISSNKINNYKQNSKAVSDEHTAKKSKLKNKNHVRVKDSNDILKDIFDKNPEDDEMARLNSKFHMITPDITTNAFHEKPYQQDNVDVTFINVDDDKEALPNFDLSDGNGQSQIKNYATKDESPTITMNTEYTTKRDKQNKIKDAVTITKPTKKFRVEHHRTQTRHWTDFLHNHLIYNNVFKQKMSKTTGSTPMTPETTLKHSKIIMKENSTLGTTVPETTATFDHFKILQNLPRHKKPPKRVQIKSHSFKYDAVYDDGISNQLGFDSTKSGKEPTSSFSLSLNKCQIEALVSSLSVTRSPDFSGNLTTDCRIAFKVDKLFKKPVTEKKSNDRGKSWNRMQKTNRITAPPKYFNFGGDLPEESRRNKRCEWLPCGRCKNCTKVTRNCSTEVTKTLKMKTKQKRTPKRRDNSKFKGYEQNTEKYQMTTKLSSNFLSNLLRPIKIPTTVNHDYVASDYTVNPQKGSEDKDYDVEYQEPPLEVIVNMVNSSIADDGTTDTTGMQKTNRITAPPKYFNFGGDLPEESRRNKRCEWFACSRCKNCTKVTRNCSTEVTKTLKKTKQKRTPKRRDNSKFKGYEQNTEKYQMTTELSSNFLSNLLRPITKPTTVNYDYMEPADYTVNDTQKGSEDDDYRVEYQEPPPMYDSREKAKSDSESHKAKDVSAPDVIFNMVKTSTADDGTTDTTGANFEYPTSGGRCKNCTKVTRNCSTEVTKSLKMKTKQKRTPKRRDNSKFKGYEQNTEKYQMTTKLSSNFLSNLLRPIKIPTTVNHDYMEPADYTINTQKNDDDDDHDEEYQEPPLMYDSREIVKRDSESHTAKDVAALEVIVDMVKSSIADDDTTDTTSANFEYPASGSLATNAIQVHISLPKYLDDYTKGKRYPERVRKVFTAKLNTPVDLEYQIHSFDDTPFISTSTEMTENVPEMYLIVESSNAAIPRGNFLLKPISHNVSLPNLRTRQVATVKELARTEKMTTAPTNKLSKVTLSKDFISAINKHLVHLYDSLIANETGHKPGVRGLNKSRVRRAIDWKKLKGHFSNDRVCNCKCSPNETMCRVCAASDAVMNELIFEINNIVQYMTDHCTEIQTYFYMNPSGGRKLRDAVKKIDKSLDDYYKRVKGKCKGKTCDAYRFIDKRDIVGYSNDIEKKLSDKIKQFEKDIHNAAKIRVCPNDKLKRECLKLVEVVNKCTNGSRIKRSKVNETSKMKDKPIKTVYSVDNVNVNIICNTDTTESFTASNQFETQPLDYHAYAISREPKGSWHFKDLFRRKHKHDNLLSFYTVENEKSTEKVRFKRKDAGSIETPLNTDTGGAFWSDYVNKIHTEQFMAVRQTSEPITEKVTNNMERNVTARNIKSNNMTFLANLITTHNATENSKLTDAATLSAVTEKTEATEQMINESLHGSINDLFKLLRSSYVKDLNENDSPVETFVTVTDSANAVTTLRSHHSNHHKKTKKKKKNKCKCKENCTCKEKTSEAKSSTQKSNKTVTTALPKKSSDKKDKTTTRTPEDISSNWLTKEAASFTNTLDEVTSATIDFVNSESSVNFAVEETTKSKEHQRQIAKLLKIFGSKRSANNTQHINEKKVTNSTSTHMVSQPISEQEVTIIDSTSALVDSPPTSEQYPTITDSSNTHVESQATTEEYPTILILNDVDNTHLMVLESDMNIDNATETNLTKSAQSDSYKSLLLSILKYKTKALKREWQKVIGRDRVKLVAQEDEDMMEKYNNFINLRIKIVNHTEPKKDDAEASRVNRDYDILTPFKNLELKPPKRIEDAGPINRFLSKFSVKTKDPFKAAKVTKGGNEPKTTITAFSNPITRVNSKDMKSTATESATLSGKGGELTDSTTTRKTCETPRRLCDMEDTFTHILISSRHMNKRSFQSFVKNITCHKHRKAPDYFYIRPKVSKRTEDHLANNKDNRIRWDWIRSKRSLHVDDENKNSKENEYETLDDVKDTKKCTEVLEPFATSDDTREIRNDVEKLELNANTKKVDDEDDKFEKLYRDRNGIYRIIEAKRKKRTVNNIAVLSRNMKNLPPIRVPKNEIYAVLGDTVTIPCYNSKGGPYSWRKDRDSVQNQVEVEGPLFVIKSVTAKDAGTYSCLKDNSLINSTKLSIVCVPTFHVVFQPLYESSRHCTVHDLKATLRLGNLMATAACPGGSCFIAIDRPACSRDVADNSSLITMTGTISPIRRGVKCSLECRRDLQCGLALLSAGNARVLSSVDVIIPRHDENVTLTPITGRGRTLVVTKTLNSGSRLDEDSTSLSPGVVDVMMSCPAGFLLVSGLKICVASPPAAVKSEPRRYRRLNKYDWWRYSYFLVASCVVLGAICAGADALFARMSERRGSETTRVAFHTVSESPRSGARARRRISPSRVILPRLFRHASSRLSQETKTSHKKKHTPPPVPSIDFDS